MACSIIGCIISILMGYDTGVMSGAMLFIKEDLKTNDTQVQVLAGILNVCALVGSLTAGRVSDRIGCRRTISLAACIFLAGSVLMGLAPNFATLLAGRCVAGVGVGYALMIAPVYAAEMSSAKIRGSLTSLPEICISFGILLGYVANFLLAKLPLVYGWRTMLGLGALPSTVLAVSVLAMPESPRWLVMQGRPDEEALAVLRRVYSDAAGEADVQLAATIGVGVTKTVFIMSAILLVAGGRSTSPTLPASTPRSLALALHGAGHRHRVHLRGVLLRRLGANHVGVQLGGVPAPTARAGRQRGGGHQPAHEHRRVHDLRHAVQGHHHWRRLLPLRGAGCGRRRLLLLCRGMTPGRGS